MVASRKARYLGVDVGGTFTDFVVDFSDGSQRHWKVATTPNDQSLAIFQGLEAANVRLDEIDTFVHGTTAAINIILQRSGSRTGLITTKGFRDIIELRRGARTRLSDPFLKNSKPHVSRQLRQEVNESIFADGTVEQSVSEEEVLDVGRNLVNRGVQSIVIAFLNAYANPENEERAVAVLRRELSDVAVSTSTEVLPLPGEYVRFVTAVLNGYVMPEMDRYLSRLREGLNERSADATLYLMHSNGGAMTTAGATWLPISLLESGPAAGVIAAQHLIQEAGIGDAITFDVGGTTAKASLIVDGKPIVTNEYEVDARREETGSGWPIGVPMLDITEIGVGGGSIVSIDDLGNLAVGPRSAGAEPGPACYGRGGQHLTLTDCAALLGIIRTGLGGDLELDISAAKQVAGPLSAKLGQTNEEIAADAFAVATASIADMLRELSVSRGFDPRDLALIAYGGAGPLLLGPIIEDLGIQYGVVPSSPGTFSARGLIVVPVKRSAAVPIQLSYRSGQEEVASAIADADQALEALLRLEEVDEPPDSIEHTLSARYVGQQFTLDVPIVDHDDCNPEAVAAAFNMLHEQRYGHALSSHDVEYTAATATAVISLSKGQFSRGLARSASTENTIKPGERSLRVGDWSGTGQVYQREWLDEGMRIDGPAVVEDYSATMLIPPSMQVTVASEGFLLLKVDR